MSMARSFLGLESESEDETWNPTEEHAEDSQDDDDIEETDNQASDDTWDADDLEELEGSNNGPEFGQASDYYPPVVEPAQDGVNLERSGSYGKPPEHYLASKKRLKDHSSNSFDILTASETSHRGFNKGQLASNHLPNSPGTEVAAYRSRIYSGQYSEDGTFFYTCTQAYRVYIYDMTVPPVTSSKISHDTGSSSQGRRSMHHIGGIRDTSTHNSSLKLIRTFQAPSQNCQWTITDASLSPDNNWLAYSSITPYVHLVKTRGEDAVLGLGLEEHEQEVLCLSDDTRPGGLGRGMGIWSLRFDSQGRQLVAGCTQGRVIAYDVETRAILSNIKGHSDDTNAVCFADKSDPNILVSGSDDSYIKVWDRRSLNNAKPAGALLGHTEGITYVSSKGDGRFIVSNGKDQAAKLWDLRKMISGADFEMMKKPRTFITGWDYRHGSYARPRFLQHPQDSSIVTYRGHSVLNTLIRVHFSPPNTTGQRYIGSGSADGNIHIWNLDGTTAQIIHRSKAASLLKPQTSTEGAGVGGSSSQYNFNDPYRPSERGSGQSWAAGTDLFRRGFYVEDVEPTVRDISWNPNEPSIMSTSWGSRSGDPGALSIHPFLPHGRVGA
ncbi:hypothetical protein PTTG_09743 [Puccinia triticina 1-1 BBBD Race 1]|uniref:WD_REPEATS_REGION domain-containing protein n=2 Tax=Puccinia triticina TaxID=208348 RepID=A0A180G9I9_PUCT1|nr:uncharacterized protein PtA15_3A199 [Puccinia triticina]OAV89280.1 hypothetical protein PTTG_09743 [Puccinia triticina 1-1 BBBD Race 1]WAQ82835.1 hypothetical protein PtA15_3A199 [Puccinia triticina]